LGLGLRFSGVGFRVSGFGFQVSGFVLLPPHATNIPPHHALLPILCSPGCARSAFLPALVMPTTNGSTREVRVVPPQPSARQPFFFTLVTGLRRSLSLKLRDTRVYEPQIRQPQLHGSATEGHYLRLIDFCRRRKGTRPGATPAPPTPSASPARNAWGPTAAAASPAEPAQTLTDQYRKTILST